MDQIISVPIPLHLILITRPYLINFINARYPTNLLWVMLCGSVILCLLVLTFPLRYPPCCSTRVVINDIEGSPPATSTSESSQRT